MAFFEYLKFDGTVLPLPDSYDVSLSAVEADSSGETEAGTTQRDVVRQGIVTISVSFSVTAKQAGPLSPVMCLPFLPIHGQFRSYDKMISQ